MQAGKLNQRIALQKQSSSRDGAGQPVLSWGDVATVWADLRHVSGIETVKADADASVVKASVRIRYRTDVVAGMRLVCSSVVYSIKAVLPDAGRQYLDLVCERS